MIRISILTCLSFMLIFPLLAQNDKAGKCMFYDTTFYYRQSLGGEKEALYPVKVVCYFTDSMGMKTTKKCTIEKFIKGVKSGAELSYYYSERVYLVNWSGRVIKKKSVKPWRRKYLLSEIPDYRLQYKGYWKNGKKHGLWTYYNREGRIVCVEEYKKGMFVKQL